MSIATRRYTVEEYFDLVQKSHDKLEYVDGEIIEMVGGSARHNQLFFNLTCQLVYRFNCPGYHVSLGNTCVRIPGSNSYYFPDAALVVGTVEREPRQLETLLNPTVVFEILSPFTGKFDRSDKFAAYQRITSFQHYVLVSQDEILVEHYSRQPDGTWLSEEATQIASAITLESLDWTLQLTDLYQGTNIPGSS